jgi:alpha-N-arabinofuranosidase
VISTNRPGTVWFSLVSLFPPTYKNRPNGNRVDIMELLAAMKPSFLRFPGGNYLEGPNFENRFNWKATIGPIEQRPTHGPVALRSSDLSGLEFLECPRTSTWSIVGLYAGLHIDGGANILTGDALKPHVQDALADRIHHGAPRQRGVRDAR